MDEETLKTLEVDTLIGLVARHATSPLGLRLVRSLTPRTEPFEVERALDVTTECRSYLDTGGGFDLSDIADPGEALEQLHVEGLTLTANHILCIERLIAVGTALRTQFNDPEMRSRYPRLAGMAARIADFRRLQASIRGKILPSGEIDDNASPELRRIRRELNERRSRIYRSLESIMRTHGAAVQEEIVTVRSGRFVIPVRTDSRGYVQGVMHGMSSSGQTTFVEPLTVIDQNNELVRLREQEEIEIAQILFGITELLRANLAAIRGLVEAVGEFDFAQCKARFSQEFVCVRPRMVSGRRLVLENARHPLLEKNLKETDGRIVPISLALDGHDHVMVISGPNAGGKTVVLKTVGLVALMAQMGLHAPATAAELPVFEEVFADIGDQQSIVANLSTFTAHMKNVSGMASRACPASLILLDEVGTGTDPDEGAALAVAIVDYFKRTDAITIATTHYNELKMWVAGTEGVLNASVEFDEQTLRPTYRLVVGIAGASSGLEIANRMGVPQAIIDEAKSRIDPQHTQAADYLRRLKALVDDHQQTQAALEEEREATARKYAGLDEEFARREGQRTREFEAELSRVIAEFEDKSRRALDEIKEKALALQLKREAETRAAELRRTAGARLRKASPQPPPAEPIPALVVEDRAIGERDHVFVTSLGREGMVESIKGDVYTVVVGSLRVRAAPDELVLVQAGAPAGAAGGHAETPRFRVDESFSPELNVIGLSSDEATDRVDKFLDDASLAGAGTVRVIHGHGKGILRRAISGLLTGHPHVESFRLAHADEGGAGATIVELRKL